MELILNRIESVFILYIEILKYRQFVIEHRVKF